MLEKERLFSLVTDGFGNVSRQHLVNFCIHWSDRAKKPVVYKIVHTGEEAQSGENIARGIIELAEEVGIEKIVCRPPRPVGSSLCMPMPVFERMKSTWLMFCADSSRITMNTRLDQTLKLKK